MHQPPSDPGEAVESGGGQPEGGGEGRGLGQEDRARTHRQRRQHQYVAAVEESGIPAQHGEQAHDQHGGGYQEVLGAPQRGHGGAGRHVARIEEHRPQGHQRAEEDQDAAELAEQLLDIALRGQDLQIHHPKEELAVEDVKLLTVHDAPRWPLLRKDEIGDLPRDGGGVLLYGELREDVLQSGQRHQRAQVFDGIVGLHFAAVQNDYV